MRFFNREVNSNNGRIDMNFWGGNTLQKITEKNETVSVNSIINGFVDGYKRFGSTIYFLFTQHRVTYRK